MTQVSHINNSKSNEDSEFDNIIENIEDSVESKTTPELPEEYNDTTRSSIMEDNNVSSHLETHWGF